MKPRKPTTEEILDIEPVEVELEYVNTDSQGSEIDVAEDYKLVREKMITAIVRGTEMLEAMTAKVKAEQGGFDTGESSKMLKSISDSCKTLFEVHEKIRALDGKKEENNKENGKVTLSQIISIADKKKAIGEDK